MLQNGKVGQIPRYLHYNFSNISNLFLQARVRLEEFTF